MNSFIRSSIIFLSLGIASTAIAEDDDRKSREDRRALKMSEVDSGPDMREKYSQAAHSLRLESIRRAKEMLKGGALTGEANAKIQFRLAEMYFEEGRFYYFNEMELHKVKLDNCYNDIPKGCDLNKVIEDHGKSQKWQKSAIRLYDDILRNYPQYQRADEVLFNLGSAYQEINEPEKAVKQFVRLTKEYSNSEYIPGAHVQIGEFYFERNKAYQALQAYQQAAKYKQSQHYGFAVYKLSWCYYNVGEYDQAIEGMKTVVRYSQTRTDAGDTSALTLEDEALKDLVRFFADAGDMQEAENYFRSLGKVNLYNNMLKLLAKMYFEQGKFEQSVTTYRKLIAENADSPEAPNYQNEIISAYQRMNEKEQTLLEIQKLLKQYGKNSPWASKNSADPESVNKAQKYVEDALRQVAVNYNEEAKKLGAGKRATETYLLAEKAYRVYLQEFPNGKNSYDMRYAFSELIYNLADKGRFPEEQKRIYFSEAYENYMKVVAVDEKGKYSEFCAEASIFAADDMIKYDKKDGLIKERKSKTDIAPIEMSTWEQKKLTALDQYTRLYPSKKNTINHTYSAAYLLFYKNQLDEASTRFRAVISMNPSSKQAMQGANLILGALDMFAQAKEKSGDFAGAAKDFAALRDTAKAFKEQEGLGNSKFKNEMAKIYETSALKEIEVVYNASPKADPDKRKAADSYIVFVKEFPDANKADIAVNIAAVYYYDLKDTKKTMETRHYLIEKYPKSKKYTENLAELGFAYESIAKFEEAATWYEKLFDVDKEYVAAKDALHRAAIFRESLGQYDQAIADKQTYMKAYSEDERVIAYPIDIANILDKKGDLVAAHKAYYNYFSKTPEGATTQSVFYTRLKYGEITKKLDKDVSKHWKNTLNAYEALKDEELKSDKFIKRVIEEVKFDLAYASTRKYFEMKISGPGPGKATPNYTKSILNKQIKKKKEALTDLETKFFDVAQMSAGKYTLSAIVEIAKAYDNYADSIKNSYIPSFLDEDQAELYKMQMEDQAYPYYEKATQTYQKALEFAFKGNVYTDATAEATRRLGELKPDEYPELTEELLKAEFLTSKEKTRTYLENAE